MARVLTTRQAAEMLGVSLRTVQLWVESGVLNAWKTVGGHRRIAHTAVEALLAQQREALGETPTDEQPRILIVEDDDSLLELYKLTIDSWGLPMQVVTAKNGFDGLIRLGQLHPDVLISDLVMPKMDGLEMIRVLRENPEYDDIAIMVVTSLSTHQIDTRGGLPGDVSRFDKPVPFDELRKRVHQQLYSRIKRRQLSPLQHPVNIAPTDEE